METSPLIEYITQCRGQGFSDDQIRSSLISAGWGESVVSESIPAMSPAVVTNLRPKKYIGLKIAGIVLVCVILSAGGTVAIAEQGYIPSVSKVYRKTLIPMAWKGTSANIPVSFGKMYIGTSSQSAVQNSGDIEIVVSSKNGSSVTSVMPADFPLLSDLIKISKPTGNIIALNNSSNKAGSNTLLSVSSDTNQPFNLPISLKINTLSATDNLKNTESSVKVDLTDLINKIPLLEQYLDSNKSNLVIQSKILPDKKHAYLYSNAIPTLDKSDYGKWFGITLPAEFIKALKDPQNAETFISKEDMATYKEILGMIAKDEGIVRINSEALAHYHITLDKESIEKIKSSSVMKNYSTDLDSLANSGMKVDFDLYLEPQTALLRQINGSVTYNYPDMPYEIILNVNEKITYDTANIITEPAVKDVIKGEATDYFTKLFSAVNEDPTKIADTGIVKRKVVEDYFNSQKQAQMTYSSSSTDEFAW